MRVSALYIYPVKGMRAWPVEEVAVEPWGLAGDRRWVIVDELGRTVTQREVPGLARVTPRPTETGLLLTAEGNADFAVPFPEGPDEEFRMFKGQARGAPAGREVSDWLSGALGRRVRLLHMARPETARALTVPAALPGRSVSYADEYPVLLASLSSLAALNTVLGEASIGMDRFRPNIVVEGLEAWAEETWNMVAIGDATFSAPNLCRRCVVITIDQLTGRIAKAGEPLKTLTRLNREGDRVPLFGRNMIPQTLGVVRIGDQAAGLQRDASASWDAA